MSFADLGSVHMLKNCDLRQHFQALGHSFSLYVPPSRQLTYISQVCSYSKSLNQVQLGGEIEADCWQTQGGFGCVCGLEKLVPTVVIPLHIFLYLHHLTVIIGSTDFS